MPAAKKGDERQGGHGGVHRVTRIFNHFANKVSHATGSAWAFMSAVLVILAWAVTGPIFHFSDTWQLVINTGTTIITFLMVFVIQQSQNKDTLAIHIKLNELIAANKGASNRVVCVEDLTDEELETIKKFYTHLAKLSKEKQQIFATHSLDEARANAQAKGVDVHRHPKNTSEVKTHKTQH